MTGVDVQAEALMKWLAGGPWPQGVNPAQLDASVRAKVLRALPDVGPVLDSLGVGVKKPARKPPKMDRSNERAVAIAAVTWAAGQYCDDSVAAGVACRIAQENGWIIPTRVAFLAIRRLRKRRGAA